MKTLITAFAVPATAIGLFAQQDVLIERKQAAEAKATMLAQGAIGMAGLAGEPGNVRFFTQELTFSGRTVTNAPYSAVEKTESVQTLADGTHITNTTTSKTYRDSQGRTRHELTMPSLGPDMPEHTMITISDPVAGVMYSLDSRTKVARKMPVPPMFSKITAESKISAESKMSGEKQAKLHAELEDFIGSVPSGTTSYRVVRSGGPSSKTKREDLPSTILEGVNVTGTRETSTIEVGAMGNDRPISITSERWYSPELQLEVKSVRNDPRMGVTTHTLTNVNRSEPDATLFQVPADYRLDEPKVGGHMSTFEYHGTEHKF
jgi:hypothetical protein